MPLKGCHVGAETAGRKTPHRARLSDITNIRTVSSSRHGDENLLSIKVSESQLHKELAILKKVVAEKEEIIKAQKVNIENLWSNYTSKTKQNEDIIQQNARLLKDMMQARDKLKILQHENVQMAATHKVYKSELQAKLAKALEQTDNSQKSGPPTTEKIPCDKQVTFPNILTKLAESRACRTVSNYEAPRESLDHVQDEGLENPGASRSTLRLQSGVSYKEPSLKAKLRQQQSSSPSKLKHCINLRESRIHHLRKVHEENPSDACIAMRCSSESKVIESFQPSVHGSAFPLTSDSSCALSADMLEDGISLPSSKSEERSNATLAAHSGSGDHLSIVTRDSASIPGYFISGRPSRQAVSCISSYKEAPLNAKLRRPS